MTVDDSPTIRELLRDTLSAAGYEVITAVDGADALGKMSASTYDMLVTDLNMPQLDGIGLVSAVRKLPGRRFLPIIMLTSETDGAKKIAGKQAGASAWIDKPFKPQQLLSLVQMVLR
jgi:two-component system chemotaxis response regulator CheY